MQTRPDIKIAWHGSIVLFQPITAAARAWIDEHVDPEAQWWGNALACELRYAEDLADGMERDGLVTQ